MEEEKESGGQGPASFIHFDDVLFLLQVLRL